MALAFRCAAPAEVDALYAQIVHAGYRGHKAAWDALRGQRFALGGWRAGGHFLTSRSGK